jgi:hypothetical protein
VSSTFESLPFRLPRLHFYLSPITSSVKKGEIPDKDVKPPSVGDIRLRNEGRDRTDKYRKYFRFRNPTFSEADSTKAPPQEGFTDFKKGVAPA